jgi:protein involved in polysaccharide export with SLBB domain
LEGTLSSLLILAGGVTNQASLSQIKVQRGGSNLTINLLAPQDSGPIANFTLQDGDLVEVPRNNSRVSILGEVRKPGSYAIAYGATISVADAIALAGGIKEGVKVEIFRVPLSAAGIQDSLGWAPFKVGEKLDQLVQKDDFIAVFPFVPKVKYNGNPEAYFPEFVLLN